MAWTLASSMLAAVPAAAEPQRPDDLWSPRPLPAQTSVEGADVAATTMPDVTTAPLKAFRAQAPAWPSPQTATVNLGPAASTGSSATATARPVPVPKAPVRIGAAGTLTAGHLPAKAAKAAAHAAKSAHSPSAVRVTTLSRTAAEKAGVRGLLLSLAPTGAATSHDRVSVEVDYNAIKDAYGGDWAQRLRLVQLPACALTTPGKPECRTQTPLTAAANDTGRHLLVADVDLPSTGTNSGSGKVTSASVTPQSASTAVASPMVVLAADATPSGGSGTYTATSLQPSSQWSVGNTGAFTWSYPITVPPALGGAAPQVALSYDSSSVDGRTSATSAQASWIGDGWDYSPGFIERSYRSCDDDGQKGDFDECWAGANATISMGSHSGQLVPANANGTSWRLSNDDGSKIDLVTGASNGLKDGEYWRLTDQDGTRYFFGVNHLPSEDGGTGTDTATQSAWGVPVYGNDTGEPCHDTTFAASRCDQMGWRWNLDFVIDTYGNTTAYTYDPETNYYAAGPNHDLEQYVRGGTLAKITYGQRTGDYATNTPAADITFTTSQRCLSTTGTNAFNCETTPLETDTASHWPDVPYDQNCAALSACSNFAPSFWSTRRLTKIQTEIYDAGTGGYRTVDTYNLAQHFPDPGDGTKPALWLDSITRTGTDINAGGPAVSLPAVTFGGTQAKPNRVDGLEQPQNIPPLNRIRLGSLKTETGEDITIAYADGGTCSRTALPAEDADDQLCYPVKWTPPGYDSPILDWFYKYPVTEIDESDSHTPDATATHTAYDYSQGKPAWHHNDDPLTLPKNRTWDQFRGFSKIITRTGRDSDPITQTATTYLQGMSGDLKADGTRPTRTVKNAFGEDVTDNPALAGTVLQTTVYSGDGGTTQSQQVTTPWLSAPTASLDLSGHETPDGTADPLPDLTARYTGTSTNRTRALLHDGTWRTTQTDTTYDTTTGLPTQVDDKGEVDSSGNPIAGSTTPEKCTVTSYAADTSRNLVDVPSEVLTLAGGCGTTPSASTVLSRTRNFYGSATLGQIAATNAGDPTAAQTVKKYDSSGNAVWTALSATSYDAYGRTISVTDALGRNTKTSLSPAADWLPTSSTVTNPKTWNTTTILDPARGLTLSTKDPNGRTTSTTYDGLGRVTEVWGPLQPKATNANTPTARFTYNVSPSVPSTVETETLREDLTYAVDYKIYDAMLRLRQEQSTPPDDAVGRIVSDTFYDTAGRTKKTYAGYFNKDSAPTGTVFPAIEAEVPSETVTTYDGQSRPVASAMWSLGTQQWQTTTAYRGMDAVDTIPPAGGYPTTTLMDGRGQKTELWQWHSATLPGTISDSDSTSVDKTTYRYDALGRQISETDTVGRHGDGKKSNTWTTAYNQLGLVATSTDPDTGTSSTEYDDAGQVTTTTDGNSSTQWFNYDELGRKTEERLGSSTGNLLATWQYDQALTDGSTTKVLGQPSKSARYDGTSSDAATAVPTSTTEVGSYTVGYKPLTTTTTVNASNTTGTISHTDTNDYSTVTEQLKSTSSPGAGGLPAETYGPSYNANGLPVSSGGAARYVAWIDYSHLGEPLRASMGNMPHQVVQTNVWEAATGRLLDSFLDKEDGDAPVDHTSYTYNAAGQITSASTIQDGATTSAGIDTQCYTYDWLGRLTQAWTDTGGTTTAASPVINGMGGCKNPAAPTSSTAASRIGGPAPYWQSFTYDATGNRWTKTVHDTKGNTAADATTNETYNASGTTGASPHAVQTVQTGSGPTDTYTYDKTGQPTTISSTSGAATSNTWDATGRLATTTTSTGTAGTITGPGGKCIDSYPAGSAVKIYTCNNTSSQKFIVKNNTIKYGSLCFQDTGTGVNGDQITTVACNANDPTQQWVPRSDTGFYNPATKKCLDLPGGNTADSTKLQLYTCNASAPQRWTAAGVHATSYTYDADGNQLTRTDDGTTTVYFGADQLTVNVAKSITGGTRYYTLPGAPTVVRTATTSAGTTAINYQAADPHGTATANIDATALTLTRRLTTPFGEPRGTNPTGWPGDHGFVNGTQDPTTGLTNLGAREYNPALGRFIDPDPILDTGNPQQWNGYAYAGNDPINASDPTGLYSGPMECLDTCTGSDSPRLAPGSQPGGAHHSNGLSSGGGECLSATGYVVTCTDLGVPSTTSSSAAVRPTTPKRGNDKDFLAGLGASVLAAPGAAWDFLYHNKTIEGAEYDPDAPGVMDQYMGWVAVHGVDPDTDEFDLGSSLFAAFDAAPPVARAESELTVSTLGSKTARVLGDCSFSPDTPVLMEQGKTKPIGTLKPGDRVEAGDPETGKHQGPRTVLARFVNHDNDLIDLTIRTSPYRSSVLHTTSKHPFWDDTLHAWVPAGYLKPGHDLETAQNHHARILAVRARPGTADMYNLTVQQLHSYYVVAGTTPVLVHNSCPPREPDPAGNIVYRALAQGEDPSMGLTARDPSNMGVSPLSHVAGKKMTPWISTSKNPIIAFEKYNQGNGVVAIDLRRTPFRFTDISDGPFPSSPRHSAYARKDSEVLIWQHVPADAIVGFWP